MDLSSYLHRVPHFERLWHNRFLKRILHQELLVEGPGYEKGLVLNQKIHA